MAAAEEKATASIKSRVSLGNGKYLYLGTLAFGKEYATGGNELVTATGERYSLPTKLDFLSVSNINYSFGLDSTGTKVTVGYSAKEKEKGEQAAAKTDLSALTAAPFMAIGA